MAQACGTLGPAEGSRCCDATDCDIPPPSGTEDLSKERKKRRLLCDCFVKCCSDVCQPLWSLVTEECSLQYLRLNFHREDAFCTSQWRHRWSDSVFMVFRLLLFGYTLFVFTHMLLLTRPITPRTFAYLTIWTFIVEILFFCSAAALTVHYRIFFSSNSRSHRGGRSNKSARSEGHQILFDPRSRGRFSPDGSARKSEEGQQNEAFQDNAGDIYETVVEQEDRCDGGDDDDTVIDDVERRGGEERGGGGSGAGRGGGGRESVGEERIGDAEESGKKKKREAQTNYGSFTFSSSFPSSSSSSSLPWYVRAHWVLANVIQVFAPVVTLVYFVALYPTDDAHASISLSDVNVHGINTAMVVLDALLSARPVRLLHVLHPVLYGVVYVVFSAVFYAADPASNVLYPNVLDWNHPGTTVLVALAVIVIIVILQLFYFGWYRLRLKIHRKIYGAEDNSL